MNRETPAAWRPAVPFDFRYWLAPMSDLLGHAPAASSRLAGRLLGPIRRLCRTLISPWLDRQTRYNEAAIDVAQQAYDGLYERVGELEEQVRALSRALVACRLELHRQRPVVRP
jgi:hypothetical protein